jgi:hypothetical protein
MNVRAAILAHHLLAVPCAHSQAQALQHDLWFDARFCQPSCVVLIVTAPVSQALQCEIAICLH